MEIAYRRCDAGERDGRGGRGRRDEQSWLRRPIDDTGLDIIHREDSSLHVEPAGTSRRGDESTELIATLLAHGTGEVRSAVLLLSREGSGTVVLLVNGFPPLSVTELPDGAEISVGAESLFFHRTGRPEIEIVDGVTEEECARCKRPLGEGDSIRRCGFCASPHHEGPTAAAELPDLWCASYDPTCARCRERWQPETSDPENAPHAD